MLDSYTRAQTSQLQETHLDLSASTLWWIVAGVLVAVELTTGTFYLLMLALGCAAGALAAHAGLGINAQVVAAALVGGGGAALCYYLRSKQPGSLPASSNPDLNLDIGSSIEVPAWGPQGRARVQYRGAAWTVRLARPGPGQPGAHVIVSIDGNELLVAPAEAS